MFRRLRLAPLWLGLLGAAPAGAVPLSFTGTLTVEFGPEGNTLFTQTVSGGGTADVTYAGSTIDAIDNLSAGAFTFAGPTFVITDPNLAPVQSIRLDATTGPGSFAGLTSGGGGAMVLDGQFTAQVNGGPLILRTNDGLGQGIGLGGSFLADGPPSSSLFFFLVAAPWTVGSATNTYGTRTGSADGNAVRLVTPFAYDPLGPATTSEGFAVLDLTFVPEPGSAALVAVGVAALGWRRRCGSPSGVSSRRGPSA